MAGRGRLSVISMTSPSKPNGEDSFHHLGKIRALGVEWMFVTEKDDLKTELAAPFKGCA